MKPDKSSHVVMFYNMELARDPQPYPDYFPFHFPTQASCSNQTFWAVDAPGYVDRSSPMAVNVTHFVEVLEAVGIIQIE
jgi:hypothetical protein